MRRWFIKLKSLKNEEMLVFYKNYKVTMKKVFKNLNELFSLRIK